MFGDPHQAATGIIPELGSLEPSDGDDVAAEADEVESQRMHSSGTCDGVQHPEAQLVHTSESSKWPRQCDVPTCVCGQGVPFWYALSVSFLANVGQLPCTCMTT